MFFSLLTDFAKRRNGVASVSGLLSAGEKSPRLVGDPTIVSPSTASAKRIRARL